MTYRPAARAQPLEVVLAGHAAVHDPDALGHAIARLHRLDDLLHGRHIRAITGEDLIPYRHPLARDHQRQADLLAVGPVIAAVAPLRQRVALRQALEVDAGHVIEEQVVVEREQLAEAGHEMLLELPLVGQQAIESPIQPVVVDQRGGQREQVFQRGAAVPVLRDVQLARRLAQPRQHQHRGHGRPRHRFPAFGQQPLQQLVQPQGAPERPPQPDIPKGAPPLQANAFEVDGDRVVGFARLEQVGLRPIAGDRTRQRLRAGATMHVQLAEVRNGLLDHRAPDPHGADELPVGVNLAVLPSRRVAQIHHSAYRTGATAKSSKLVSTTRQCRRHSADATGRYRRRDRGDRAVSLLKPRKLG